MNIYPTRQNVHSDYNDFRWQLFRVQIAIRDGFKCQFCGSLKNINIHHLVYLKDRRIWEYPNNYMITLCEKCHNHEHDCLLYFNEKKIDISHILLSGMLAIDMMKKLRNNENLELNGKSFRK